MIDCLIIKKIKEKEKQVEFGLDLSSLIRRVMGLREIYKYPSMWLSLTQLQPIYFVGSS